MVLRYKKNHIIWTEGKLCNHRISKLMSMFERLAQSLFLSFWILGHGFVSQGDVTGILDGAVFPGWCRAAHRVTVSSPPPRLESVLLPSSRDNPNAPFSFDKTLLKITGLLSLIVYFQS